MKPILQGLFRLLTFTCCLSLLAACAGTPSSTPLISPTLGPDAVAIFNGTLIDGRGGLPQPDAVLIYQDGRILVVGPRNSITIPSGIKTIDAQGGTILPGFINAHVHDGFNAANLEAWARGGVTTVRDEGLRSGRTLIEQIAWRRSIQNDPRKARLVSAGWMITVPNGYGGLYVRSPEDARSQVLAELDQGADLIKLSMEDGYAGTTGLPKLSTEEIAAIISAAHERQTLVSGHITQARFMQILVEAGVDDIAHLAYDPIPDETLRMMVAKDIYLTPTFTVFRNYGAPVSTCVSNLAKFVKLGGKVALGNDYGGGPGSFELGMPMYEIEKMADAGMTPMQIIVAGTLNAAHVAGIETQAGSLEPGKQADVLIITGDPLQDLQALSKPLFVIRQGMVIVSNE